MNYDNALNLILQKQSLGIKPGLTRIYELLNKMDNPQDKISIIHIAGTNGRALLPPHFQMHLSNLAKRSVFSLLLGLKITVSK